MIILFSYFSRAIFRNVHLDLKSSEYSQPVGGREGSKSNPPEIDGRIYKKQNIFLPGQCERLRRVCKTTAALKKKIFEREKIQ